MAEDLIDMLNQLDEEDLKDLSDEKIQLLSKQLNMYGTTIEGSGNYLTFSYTDLRQDYLKKLLLTGMVGFLNRMCDEWNVPDDIPVIPVYDYLKNPDLLNFDALSKGYKSDLFKNHYDENMEWMKKRIVVKEFIEHLFQYNPDIHVRSMYKPNPEDKEREIVDTPIANLSIKQRCAVDKDLNDKMTKFKKSNKVAGSRRPNKQKNKINKKVDLNNGKDDSLEENTTEMIPSMDTFNRWNRYIECNYDELRGITNMLYCEKPDIDTALNPYCFHKDEEEANKFIKKHESQVIAPIHIAESGKWNMFGPFKKNLERTRYYNEETHIIEEMMRIKEEEVKQGKLMVDKRIRMQKNKNIKESGPDDPKWKEFSKEFNPLAKTNQTLKDSYIEDDCPDNAVEVGVFRISQGGLDMNQTKFYMPSEAPDEPTELKE